MTNVVSESATGRRTADLCAELALKALDEEQDPRRRLRSVVEQVLVFTGATLVAVFAPGGPDGDGDLSLVESAGLPRSLYGLRARYSGTGGSPVAVAHREGTPVWLGPDVLAALPEGESPQVTGASVAVLPLDGGRRGAGCLLVVTDRPDGFDAGDRQWLELLAAAIGCPAPGHAPAPDTRRDHAPGPDGADGLGGGDGVDGSDGRASSFRLAMDSGRIDIDDAVLALFGLAPADFDGRVETLLALTVPEDLPTLMSVVEADHMAIGDRELDFRIRRPSGEPRWLRLRGQVVSGGDAGPARLIGTVLDASNLRPGVNDVARVQRLAAVLATASTVREASQAVAGGLRAPLRADRIALAELEGDRLVVTVLDPPQPDAWPESWRSEWRSEWPDAPVRAMPTLAAAIADGRATVLDAGTPLEPNLAAVGPGGLAILPLPAGGRMAGVCLIGWDTPHAFGSEERAFLTAAAGLAGQALMRVHAFDAEHELVSTLQRSLLPRRLPDLPGGRAVARYLPTTAGLEVGGDWYDVIPLTDNHVALVIGDVQGHNAGAATLMGQMRTALRAYAVEGHPPDVVVSHANRLLVGMETDLFATCCYVDVDMEAGTALCVRAGHLPPVVRRADGSTVVIEAEGGPPLGVITEADFPMTPLRLQPGMVVALTTDGLVESADRDIDVGLAQLGDTFSATDPTHLGLVADALLDGANRDDDVALLLLRYDGMAVLPRRESWSVWRVPEAARHARRFTKRTLRAWFLTGDAGSGDTTQHIMSTRNARSTDDIENIDTVLLVVSELVTNALVHTDGPVRLDLTLVGGRLRIAVCDASPRTPVKPTNLGWEATGGRGILLVEAMSAAWGTVPVSGGKQVWGEVVVG
ncbi:SpoIIE family protein phosphatase [Streptomyces sp. NPDC058001]|uniref:SpoIIE family protein phosphatase n=1 Tax=Streptomyces sp. NPDC058001 TaxID=3346300 RepID=UPI0036E55E64